jgi:dihydroorotate dehydrogenase (fumarate)
MDLATTYLGLSLRNPLLASASPLSQSADRVIELVEAGVSAVVLHSLFEEQIEHPTPDADVPHFFDNPAGPDAPKRYLDLIEECVRSVHVPVIASINGTSRHGWTSFARNMQDAGAAAVECNFYNVPQRMQGPGRDVEARCMDVVHALKQELGVPVAVKLTPYFSSFGELALRLVETGADGLVLFNRFLQPRVDVQTLTVAPVIELSHSSDARLPQTWIALLREQLTVSLAGTSGVEIASDLVAYLLAGADVVEARRPSYATASSTPRSFSTVSTRGATSTGSDPSKKSAAGWPCPGTSTPRSTPARGMSPPYRPPASATCTCELGRHSRLNGQHRRSLLSGV